MSGIEEQNNLELIRLKEIKFQDFKNFNDSLTVERETWSLDFNLIYPKTNKPVRNIKEWYEVHNEEDSAVWMLRKKDDGELIGLVHAMFKHPDEANHIMQAFNLAGNNIMTLSFVVHRKHQGKGFGTLLIKKIVERKYQVGIDAFHAVYLNNNVASHIAFKKNGFLVYSYFGELKDQLCVIKKITSSMGGDKKVYMQPKIINNKLTHSPMTFCISTYNNNN